MEGRRTDPLWDALVGALGLETSEVTATERGRLNAALKELRSVGATPRQIHERVDAWRQVYKVPCSPQALAGNWSALGAHVTRTRPRMPQRTPTVEEIWRGAPARLRALVTKRREGEP